jgi:hypothetical protein
VRPEFFADDKVSRLSVGTRLTYVGLWCVADDAGWLAWDVASIGAQLYPYESVRVRERRLQVSGEELVNAGRVVMHECGCAVIPALPFHQKIGGNKSFSQKDRHDKSHVKGKVHTFPDVSPGRYVGSEVGNSRERETSEDGRAGLLAAFAKQGLPVDVQ